MPDWLKNVLFITAAVVVVAALVVGTVLTGGTLGVVLAGAAIGAIGGGAGATISTAISGDWSNYGSNLFGGVVFGGISGAVGATGIGLLGQIAINAGLGIANYAFSALASGDNITAGGLVFNGVLGGVAGAFGGAGSGGSALSNNFIASGSKNFFGYAIKNFSKDTIKAMFREAGNDLLIGGAVDGLLNRLRDFLNKGKKGFGLWQFGNGM